MKHYGGTTSCISMITAWESLFNKLKLALMSKSKRSLKEIRFSKLLKVFLKTHSLLNLALPLIMQQWRTSYLKKKRKSNSNKPFPCCQHWSSMENTSEVTLHLMLLFMNSFVPVSPFNLNPASALTMNGLTSRIGKSMNHSNRNLVDWTTLTSLF